MIDISWLVEHGPCKKYNAGDTIEFSGGSNSVKAMYILLVGIVDVYKESAAGGMQKISTLISGDVFGGREYFTGASDYKYVCGNNTVVYVVTEESFNDLSWSRPDILFEILRAAYLPIRKPSASTPAITATQTPKLAPVEPQTQPPQTEFTSVSVTGGIFPDGHKSYKGYAVEMNMQLIFPKEYSCPFCKSLFSDFRVFRSKLYESQPMRFDLRKFYNEFQTEWYDVITCHSCLFSAFHNYFTDPKPIKKANIEKALTAMRAEIMLDFDSARDINYVFGSHYLAILCAEGYPTMDKQIRAKLWGNLSWLYEDLGDKDMEKFAATQAAEIYEQVYTQSRLTPVQEQITCLSIAGMQYRAGIDNNLRKLLFTAKTHSMGDKQYSKIAEDFMYELKIENE